MGELSEVLFNFALIISLLLVIIGIYSFLVSEKTAKQILKKQKKTADDYSHNIKPDDPSQPVHEEVQILMEMYYNTQKERSILLIITILVIIVAIFTVLLGLYQLSDNNYEGILKVIVGVIQMTFFYLLKRKDAEILFNKSEMLIHKKTLEQLRIIKTISVETKRDEQIIKTLEYLRQNKYEENIPKK